MGSISLSFELQNYHYTIFMRNSFHWSLQNKISVNSSLLFQPNYYFVDTYLSSKDFQLNRFRHKDWNSPNSR